MKKSLDPKRDRDSFRLWAGSITWGNNAPVKYQFGGALTGPWHDTMTANDKYRRDSLDGGTTWGDPYQFKGTDGKNGSVDYSKVNDILKRTYGITSTAIGESSIESPVIMGGEIYGAQMYANEFNVMPGDESNYAGAFNLYGMVSGDSTPWHMFQILYDGSTGYPFLYMSSPAGAELSFGTSAHSLRINLSHANIIDWGNNAPIATFG